MKAGKATLAGAGAVGSRRNLVGCRKCMDVEVGALARLDPGGGCEMPRFEVGWCLGSIKGPVHGCRWGMP